MIDVLEPLFSFIKMEKELSKFNKISKFNKNDIIIIYNFDDTKQIIIVIKDICKYKSFEEDL